MKHQWNWRPIGTGFSIYVPHMPWRRRKLLSVLLGSKWEKL
jgi:hypothetical protein